MNYPNFYEKIIAQYGIDVVGWPCRFVNPSDLNQTDLSELRDAWANKTCYFKKLTREEREARAAQHEADLATGKAQKAIRKPQKDKGGTHSYARRHISNSVIEDDDENSGSPDSNDNQDSSSDNGAIDNINNGDTNLAIHIPLPSSSHPASPATSIVPSPPSDLPGDLGTNPERGRVKRVRHPPNRLPQLVAPLVTQSKDKDNRPTKKRRTK
jgi:hypothetical protein